MSSDPTQADANTVFVLVLGPAAVVMLIGALIYWLRHRAPPGS